MEEIFKFYFDVSDPYERKHTWISHKYPFPELSGLNADYVIKKWIMSYMAILFLRQWTIYPYLMTMRPLDFPSIPPTQGEMPMAFGQGTAAAAGKATVKYGSQNDTDGLFVGRSVKEVRASRAAAWNIPTKSPTSK